MLIESNVVKSSCKRAKKIQLAFLVASWRGMRHGYTTTIHSVSLKRRSGKKPEEKTTTRPRIQRSTGKIMMTIFWDNEGILLTDYLSLVATQLMANIMHHSSIDYVLLFWRNGVESSAVECCFFTTMHLFTSPTLHKLPSDELASPNWTILLILQILHRVIITCFQIWKNFFMARILAPMITRSCPCKK